MRSTSFQRLLSRPTSCGRALSNSAVPRRSVSETPSVKAALVARPMRAAGNGVSALCSQARRTASTSGRSPSPLAATAAKAPTPDAQVKLAKSAHDAIVVERSLHEGFFRDYGIDEAVFRGTPPSPTCRAYGDFLMAAAHVRPYSASVAALLPCFQIYYEVGKHLLARAARPNPYQRWIDTYADEAFGDSVREMLRLTDAVLELEYTLIPHGLHVVGRPPKPAARLEIKVKPATFNPAARARMASGTVDMPTASAPRLRNARISAGVS